MYVVNALFIEDGPTFPMNGALLYGFISLYILFMILINLIYSFGWPYHLRTVIRDDITILIISQGKIYIRTGQN